MSHLRQPRLASAVVALVLVLRVELVKTPDDTGKRRELGSARRLHALARGAPERHRGRRARATTPNAGRARARRRGPRDARPRALRLGHGRRPTHATEVALVPIDRGLCALVDDETEAGTLPCDIDARPDAHDHRDVRRTRRFVVAGDDAGLATVLEVPLAVHECEHRYTTEVTFDGRGHARVTASEGPPPRAVLGRHDLTE